MHNKYSLEEYKVIVCCFRCMSFLLIFLFDVKHIITDDRKVILTQKWVWNFEQSKYAESVTVYYYRNCLLLILYYTPRLNRYSYALGGYENEPTCGRPLGMRLDADGYLIVCDTALGIYKINVATGMSNLFFILIT